MFKVVTDQLKVSQGWVRCGQCADVFDATRHLQSAPAAVPPLVTSAVEADPLAAQPPQPLQALPSPSVPFLASESLPQEPLLDPPPQVFPGDDSKSDFDPAQWQRQQAEPALDDSGALRLNARGEAVRTAPGAADATDLASASLLAHQEAETVELPQVGHGLPEDVSFVRDARRRAFWHRPSMRVATALAALSLACLLLLQILVAHRDTVAAFAPGLRPMLQTLCAQWHCEVGPLRRIEAVVIDSSSFNKIDSNSYRLNFSIRNTGAVAVAMPSLEVSLTDAQDQPLVRRVLAPAQLGATMATLAGGSDFAGTLLLQVVDAAALPAAGPGAPSPVTASALRVAGYRVLAFYP